MDPTLIEERIKELEYDKLQVQEKIELLKKHKEQLRGAITEMWKWHEENRGAGEYGQLRYDGRAKIHKLPELGSAAKVKEAIENRSLTSTGIDEKQARVERTGRARDDAKKTIDKIDKMNQD